MTEPTLQEQLVDIVNQFIEDNRLVNADLCEEDDKLKGMHAGLTIGGANDIIDTLQAVIEKAERKARLDELTWAKLRFVVSEFNASYVVELDDRIKELKEKE